MFHRTARLPIDMEEDRLSDPDERLAHYHRAIEKDEEVAAKEASDLLKNVKENVAKAQAKQKKYYDSKHGAGASYKLDALVLKRDFLRSKRKGGKLDPKWLGPYRISKVLGKGLYSLTHCKGGRNVKRVNGFHLKLYHVSDAQCLHIHRQHSCVTGDTHNCC